MKKTTGIWGDANRRVGAEAMGRRGNTRPSHSQSMRILIADDHAVVRHGLKQILAEAFRGAVFGDAGNAGEVVSAIEKEPWDVVVLDISMPDRSGLEVLCDIRK